LPAAGHGCGRLLVWAAVLAAFDQATKWLAHNKIRGVVVLVQPWFTVVPSRNYGGLFGYFQGARALLATVSGVVLLALIVWAWRSAGKSRLMDAALVLAVAGAAGNLADRLALGYVRDLVHLGFWPAFNLADALITAAIVIFLLAALRGHGR
jgi:signal peptidase II